jgi:L-asparaginase II
MSELLVEVRRGGIVESRHFGDLAIVNRQGRLLWYAGDPYRVTFARSSAKPWQTVPLIETGAADAFQMTTEEIALSCASHSGEEQHVGRVLAFLERIGISPEKLQCGAHAPYHAPSYEELLRSGREVTAVHNNCSGKHAGMLALAKFLKADLDTYLNLDHPVQQQILNAVSELCEVAKEDIAIGIDGCGVPVFGLPVIRMAHAYAKLADPSGLPERRQAALTRICQAMLAHPNLVAGTERFCTALMEAGGGAIVGKAGAEGIYCVGLPEAGIGLALKVDDGNARAAYPAVVEALRQAGLVSDRVVESLQAFHNPELKNHKGTVVGEISPVLRLHKVV